MSASLVGSEMCIRDRGGPENRRPRGRILRRWARAAQARSRARGPRTVSYTHLTLPRICSV
eukprot:11486550-Alexandrium_andersonii.AAC.1